MTQKQLKLLFTKDLQFIVGEITKYYPNFSLRQKKKVTQAFWFAAEAHDGQTRFSGEPYFTHPIAATKILLQIKPDVDTICACLMHDVIEDTPITATEVEALFGSDVRFLCEGVEKVSKVRLKGEQREHESLKKLFIAMAKDIRVIFIKLADRIHNLQTLDHVRPEKRQRIAEESIKIYASVAEKLGLYEFKHEIEDLCFKWLNPDMYEDISQQRKISVEARKDFINNAKEALKEAFSNEGVKIIEIKGRYKNLYSIYDKLKRKNFSHVSELFDLIGLRVTVEANSDCYRCLGAIHARWKPISSRFKDYIAVPKPNGYQSLHTTILGLANSKTPTEIQIRTEQMHLDAEFGPAAHWAYKQVKNSSFNEDYLKKMNWLPNTIQSEAQNLEAQQFFQKISESLTQDRIHVFTPKGDIENLVKGATIVDFAYSIHSGLGHTCIAGKINGAIKPLSHELKNGDVVEIVARTGRGPNPLWLNFVKSPSARGHIRTYLNKHQIKTLPREVSQERDNTSRSKTSKLKLSSVRKRKNELLIGGQKTQNFHFAACCKPQKNNEIVAYVPRGTRFSVHQKDCKTVEKLSSERLLDANFLLYKQVTIEGTDRRGMMRQIFDALEDNGQNISDSKLKTSGLDNQNIEWKISVETISEKEFAAACNALRKIPNVTRVQI